MRVLAHPLQALWRRTWSQRRDNDARTQSPQEHLGIPRRRKGTNRDNVACPQPPGLQSGGDMVHALVKLAVSQRHLPILKGGSQRVLSRMLPDQVRNGCKARIPKICIA